MATTVGQHPVSAFTSPSNGDALDATVVRDNLVRLDRLPLVIRVPSLRSATAGEKVRISLSKLDFWELSVHAEHLAPPSADGPVNA